MTSGGPATARIPVHYKSTRLASRDSAPAVQRSRTLPEGFYNSPVHDVLVYSREGCHLCDIVKGTLTQLQSSADFRWRDVDIDTDPALRGRYNDEVPVFIDGRKAFKYHMDAGQFLRALAGTP